VKNLFKNIGVEPTVVEIDQLEDGPDVQAALMDVSGSRTVPQIFIGEWKPLRLCSSQWVQ